MDITIASYLCMMMILCVIIVSNALAALGRRESSPKPHQSQKTPLETGDNARVLLTNAGARVRVSELDTDRTLVEDVTNLGGRMSAKVEHSDSDTVINRLLGIQTDELGLRTASGPMAVRRIRRLPAPVRSLPAP